MKEIRDRMFRRAARKCNPPAFRDLSFFAAPQQSK